MTQWLKILPKPQEEAHQISVSRRGKVDCRFLESILDLLIDAPGYVWKLPILPGSH